MKLPTLRMVTRLQGNNAALRNGDVPVDGFSIEFEDVPVLVDAFRRMVRNLEFDVCEMAITTYMCARDHGVKFTALPIFLVRGFHHGAILHNTDHPVSNLTDLQGRRVGVNRGYTVTTGVWARAILEEEYGVDLARVNWVLSGDEHVEAYRAPRNVSAIPAGQTIEGLLKSNDLAAAINIDSENPKIRPVIADPFAAGLNAYRNRGHYPINHLIVVRDDVLARHPGLGIALFESFTGSRNLYLEKLKSSGVVNPTKTDTLHARIMELGSNPLPYGIAANRRVIDDLIKHAVNQQILTRAPNVESLFAKETWSLSD